MLVDIDSNEIRNVNFINILCFYNLIKSIFIILLFLIISYFVGFLINHLICINTNCKDDLTIFLIRFVFGIVIVFSTIICFILIMKNFQNSRSMNNFNENTTIQRINRLNALLDITYRNQRNI